MGIFAWLPQTATKRIPIGAFCQRPLPKSALIALAVKPAMISVLKGSTGLVEISFRHGLSIGKISMFSTLAFVALQLLVPGFVGLVGLVGCSWEISLVDFLHPPNNIR